MRRRQRDLRAELDDLEARAGAPHGDAGERAARDRAAAGLIRRLVDATLRLEGLTMWLIALTVVLAFLTAVLALGEADRIGENVRRMLHAFVPGAGGVSSMWPLALLLDVFGALWIAYGGWVTVSALLRRRPKDIARLASRVEFGVAVTPDVEYEFDESDAWKLVRESVDARIGTRFLIVGAALSILGRVV